MVACHCVQCRKASGHYWAATHAPSRNITMIRGRSLAWFRSSDHARKGFCRRCGSWLFWRMDGRDGFSISGGAFDCDLPVRLEKHIFVSEKGSYYEIGDGLPQADGFDLDANTRAEAKR